MGLDQYVYASLREIDDYVDFELFPAEDHQVWYFRKHPNLHGWMHDLYKKRNGSNESFNTSPIRLTIDDLLKLRVDVLKNRLPDTEGFFFGVSHPYHKDETLRMIDKALAYLGAGDVVYYYAWY